MAKHPSKDNKTIYPDDENWMNYKTDINDGWADDVPLLYDKDKWTPDEDEFTTVKLDIDEINSALEESNSKDTDSEVSDSEDTDIANSKDNPKRSKPFRLFMICWLGTLAIIIAVLLGMFLDYLVDYQNEYEATRPYHYICSIVDEFDSKNYDVLYNYITAKPDLNEFESQEIFEMYMDEVVGDAEIGYIECDNFNEEHPKYYITADGYIIANIELRKDSTRYAKYQFPVWYVSSFEFYNDPQHSITIEVPMNYTVSVNGIEVSDDYCIKSRIILDGQQYYKDYAKLPTLKRLKIDGLFELPYITVYDSQGIEVPATLNESTGIYQVPLGSYLEDADDAKDFAINLISDYTNFVSGDEPRNILDDRFIPQSDMLELINSGTFRQYFNSHIGTSIKDAKVTEFVVYNSNAVFCRVALTQIIQFNSVESTDNYVDLGVYMLRTDDGWKACTIQY